MSCLTATHKTSTRLTSMLAAWQGTDLCICGAAWRVDLRLLIIRVVAHLLLCSCPFLELISGVACTLRSSGAALLHPYCEIAFCCINQCCGHTFMHIDACTTAAMGTHASCIFEALLRARLQTAQARCRQQQAESCTHILHLCHSLVNQTQLKASLRCAHGRCVVGREACPTSVR